MISGVCLQNGLCVELFLFMNKPIVRDQLCGLFQVNTLKGNSDLICCIVACDTFYNCSLQQRYDHVTAIRQTRFFNEINVFTFMPLWRGNTNDSYIMLYLVPECDTTTIPETIFISLGSVRNKIPMKAFLVLLSYYVSVKKY